MSEKEKIKAIKEYLIEERRLLSEKLIELEYLKKILSEFKKVNETYIKLGEGIFFKGSIIDDQKFLVNVGNNVYIEKSKEDLLKILDENIKKIEDRIKEIDDKLNKFDNLSS